MNGPMRRIDLCGVPNFRDLGGYAAVDGRRVRWRRLFRSSHLGSLSAADQMLLAADSAMYMAKRAGGNSHHIAA